MKNRPLILTEWEDNIRFDSDDPDFHDLRGAIGPAPNISSASSSPIIFNVKSSSTMSLASLHGPQFDMRSPLGHHSVSSSISDLVGSPFDVTSDNVVSIEELRQHMGSCFSCGVSWTDEHVSLDCSECGGYSLTRPCPVCDGRCGVKWQRDFTMSHAVAKARWQGVCSIYPERLPHLLNPLDLPLTIPVANANAQMMNGATNATAGIGVGATVNTDVISATVNNAAAATTQLLLAQELCARLEQLQTSPRI